MSLMLPRTIELAPNDAVFMLTNRRCYCLKKMAVFPANGVGKTFIYERCSARIIEVSMGLRHPCRHQVLRISITVLTIPTVEATQSRLQLKMRIDEKDRIKQILMHLARKGWNRFVSLDPQNDQEKFRQILFGGFQTALNINGYQLLDTNFNLEQC